MKNYIYCFIINTYCCKVYELYIKFAIDVNRVFQTIRIQSEPISSRHHGKSYTYVSNGICKTDGSRLMPPVAPGYI